MWIRVIPFLCLVLPLFLSGCQKESSLAEAKQNVHERIQYIKNDRSKLNRQVTIQIDEIRATAKDNDYITSRLDMILFLLKESDGTDESNLKMIHETLHDAD